MTEYFPWKEEYKLGIEVIDKQHEYFVSLMNKLYRAILNLEPLSAKIDIVNELAAYAQLHFDTEEKYFDEFHYEGAAEHKEEHHLLKERVMAFQSDANLAGKIDSFEIIDFLEEWLINHLDSEDKKYVDCFHQHGLK